MPNKTLAALMMFAALALPAAAHTYLQTATPEAGANLTAPPSEIVMQFSGDLEPAFSSITVTDEKDHVVNAGASVADGKTMRAALKPLKPGRYRVTWVAVSIDTHRSEGKYNFLILP
ncbi:MAG TPA: copper resistance CopC family protein [Rhizomicrobium sp.]|nr:copper resistance CopC family protein [Rhizomicrobium sp.]